MKKALWIYALIFGLILSCNTTYTSSFAQNKAVVIPMVEKVEVEKPNYSPAEKTGQTLSSASGDDGDLETGVAWPVPRFTDNVNGTVTDNLTGLIWMKNAACFDASNWETALANCNTLNSGECGLTDGSVEGKWRLPNVNELFSLIHHGFHSPAVPNTNGTGICSEGDPFNAVGWGWYWTSTSNASNFEFAWRIYFRHGHVELGNTKDDIGDIWCVRDGK